MDLTEPNHKQNRHRDGQFIVWDPCFWILEMHQRSSQTAIYEVTPHKPGV